MSENEQVYEFPPPHPYPWNQTRGAGPQEPPKPYHPQSRFGSGVQPAALAYPNLAKYYGETFAANFTTMDLLDSLAARVAIIESQPHEDIYQALRQISLTSEETIENTKYKPPWWLRLLYKVQGRMK